jgi:hypothetical protein
MYIWNEFGLWKWNEELREDICRRLDIPIDKSDIRYWQLRHPDEASMEIL